jgi:gamma-glutamyltranspeptidase / glutathione hydrolase
VEAGLEALRKGGNAADAAATVALTQVMTQLGSVVSYAGILTMLYYDAKTGKVWSLDAGYGTYRGETDPNSIPASDLSALTGGPPPPLKGDLGRQTLVPGFMAGIAAMEKRFGRLSLADALAPAIWYADHGVKISAPLAGFFRLREKQLARTEEGRRFLHQAGDDLPKLGDTFRQPELAATLRSVARNGVGVMYTGPWAEAFVEAVQHDGGKATLADLAAYGPEWSEAAYSDVFRHVVYTNGGSSLAPYQLLTALNAAEALKLDKRGPYWSDAVTFRDLTFLGEVAASAPVLPPAIEQVLRAQGADTSAAGQRTKRYATTLAAWLPSLYASPDSASHHSNALVVVDKEGNVAVVTHTINSVIWGDTGIVVGGIPIPDSAGFQQARLAHIQPGARLPNNIDDTLVMNKKGRPVLATASIGSSLLPETLRVIVSCIGQTQPLALVAAKPPLLVDLNPQSYTLPLAHRPVVVPADAYDASFLASLRASGVEIQEVSDATAGHVRGTLALIGFDPETGVHLAPETPGVMVFAGIETENEK